jgi:hypothetical protein
VASRFDYLLCYLRLHRPEAAAGSTASTCRPHRVHFYYACVQKFAVLPVLLSFVLFMKVANISVYGREECVENYLISPAAGAAAAPMLKRSPRGDSQGAQPFRYSAIHRLLHGHFQVNLAVQHPACRR